MNYTIFDTALGKIVVAGNEHGLAHLMIDNQTKDILIEPQWQHSDHFFKQTKQQIIDYINGKRQHFELLVNPAGTPFQRKVWQTLQSIPYGETRSYKDIAEAIGQPTAARAIGMANNHNPIPLLIPCHRVVGANGELTGYAYGTELKAALIELEQKHVDTIH